MRFTVIGAGFAALTAVKTLRKLAKDAEITVVAPQAELVYLPSIIWLPAGLRTAEDLKVNLTNFFKKMRVNFIAGRVQGIYDGGRSVHTEDDVIHNDALIIASGGRFIKKLPGIEHVITPCEGIPSGEAIRDRLAAMQSGTIALGFGGNPNEPAAMRGGPMFEFVFNIECLLRQQGRRDQFKLVFFNPKDKPGARLGPDVPSKLVSLMQKKGVETHLGHKINGFTANSVQTEGGDIAADLILFMPGMTGPAWLDNTSLPKSPGGMIVANEHTQVEGFEHVYVAGDAGSFPGPDWQPKQAHAADIQAKVAATNAVRLLTDESAHLEVIRHELVCIVDTLSHGIFIKRNEKGSRFLPPLRIMHYAKRFFEKQYLRQYRG
ncbi:NAD(P)/FAD-dependent oxidoreductase [Aliidiomarina haloalkalitolerans]|uniref:Pyridine nucleotide-disulfide oxidoreductase n=1 Tax=Aliidiomarina haloalkalitolerans TaxID=859059 RepID=A0A432VTK9_9GAMM|nr:FAD-dependent oxidoreductase [Aliidiomarina haloalkalitolerans]RUO19815.1 pyridine nucleotide-disulfide oxidoreductase [Aliidiomarina haloalkalitolerans]